MFVIQDAKDRCDPHTYATKNERWEAVRRAFWSAHPQSPTFDLSEKLRRVEWEDAGLSMAGGSRS